MKCWKTAALGTAMLLAVFPRASMAGSDALERYLSLATGSFDSSVQAARDQRYDHAIWHAVEIWPGDARERWTYSENWINGAETPYRQRITRYTTLDDGSILAQGFVFPGAAAYVGAWREPSRFAELERSLLDAGGSCEARIAHTGESRFEGGTSGQSCRNTYKGAAYMVSHSVVDANGLVNWDRGFDADGRQVWGPRSGGYRFLRTGAAQCAEPVLMLVHGEIRDRARFGAYIKALGESGLYPRNRGYYRAISPALEVFEGKPPPERGIVLARFPCLAAAQAFWNSGEYAEIRKLREGIADFEVTVLRELPVPDYADW